MDATIVSNMQKHYPVLLKEIISIISPQYGGTFIDCTFGQGGYSKKILEFEDTKVIALDRDIESEAKANQIKNKFEDNKSSELEFSVSELNKSGASESTPNSFRSLEASSSILVSRVSS